MTRATGTFDVTPQPEPPYDTSDGVTLTRVRFDKQFHGDLEATSVVNMISATGTVEGSAGYVAMERVVGKLQGRAGGFVLQHSGTMNRGAASLDLAVVPDTGTGDLTGLSGRMTIEVVEGEHRYVFEYELE